MPAARSLTIDELKDEFDFLGEWEDQCRYLIDLGEELPDLPVSEKTEANRVHGCQSRVWMVSRVYQTDGTTQLEFRAKSDARIVDGLIVVLLTLFNGKTPKEVLETDFRGAFIDLGLETHLVPQRRNGLYSMVERVRSTARTLLENTPVVPSEGRANGAASNTAANGTGSTTKAPVPPSMLTEAEPTVRRRLFDVDEIRADFPVLNQTLPGGLPVTYLDSASSAQKPQVVIDKEREVYEEYFANGYRGGYRFGTRISSELEKAREKVRRFIGAPSIEEIVFTSGTTMSINLVANAWGRKFLQPDDEILVSEMEHHANLVPWQWIAAQTGAKLRFIPLTDDGRIDMDAYADLVNDRTKLLAITGMSNVLGTAPPLQEMIRRAKSVGALALVDGAQSVAHWPVNVATEGIDFFAFSGHKTYGPTGVGVLYGRRELLEAMDPFLCGGHMISAVHQTHSEWAAPPAKFEAGTLPIAQVIALGTALDYISALTLCPIHKHEQSLLRYAHEKMTPIPGLKIYGPAPSEKGAIVSFTIDGAAAYDLDHLLDLRGICVRVGHHCTMPLHERLGCPATVRASFGMYNTLEDVDRLVDALDFARTELGLP